MKAYVCDRCGSVIKDQSDLSSLKLDIDPYDGGYDIVWDICKTCKSRIVSIVESRIITKRSSFDGHGA